MGFLEEVTWGPLNALIECPHCHTQGHVRTKPVRMKRKIDSDRETGAVLVARKSETMRVYCCACGMAWHEE